MIEKIVDSSLKSLANNTIVVLGYESEILQRLLINKNITGTPIAASSEVHWKRTKEYYDVSWRGTWEGEGGGVILSHAIHLHDLLSFIFGDIKSVSANLATLVNNIAVSYTHLTLPTNREV